MTRYVLILLPLIACAGCAQTGPPPLPTLVEPTGLRVQESFERHSPFRQMQSNCEVKVAEDGLVEGRAGRYYRLDATFGKNKEAATAQALYLFPIASMPIEGELRLTARIQVDQLPKGAKVHVGLLMHLPAGNADVAQGGYTVGEAGERWHTVQIDVPKLLDTFATPRGMDKTGARLNGLLLIVEGPFDNSRVALKVDDVTLFSSKELEREVAINAYVRRANGAAGVAYAMTAFETLVPPIGLPPAERSETMTIAATPGEFEPATFAFFPTRHFSEVTLKTAELTGPAGARIPAAAIDARVVKIWWQQGPYNQYQSGPAEIPELLVKDDRVRLAGIKGVRPDLRLTGDVKTELRAGRAKQFWITVRVPEGAKPGAYSGPVTLMAGDEVLATLRLNLTVLPFTLDDHGKDIGIYFQSKLVTDKPEGELGSDQVSERLLRLQFADMKEHGITAPTCYTSHTGELDKFIGIMKEYGFRGPIGYMGGYDDPKELAKIDAKFKAAGLGGLAVYLHDEPSTDEAIASALKVAAEAREAGVLTWAAMLNKRAVREIGSKLDINNWMIATEFQPPQYFRDMKARRAGQKPIHKKYWYYWQSLTEHPLTNRTFVGLYLSITGFDGICPYVYQTCPKDLYDNDDRWSVYGGTLFRMHQTNYPSKNGPITTIQWEGWREGVDDLRYITTLKNLVNQAGPAAKKSPAVQRGAKLLAEIQAIGADRVTAKGLFDLRGQLTAAIVAIQKRDRLTTR